MPQRLNAAHPLIAIGAVALIVSLFLDWYEDGFEGAMSAWTAFEVVDLLLAAIAVAALAAVLVPLVWPGHPVGATLNRWHAPLGVAALVLVLVALINHPPAAIGQSPAVGAWIGLIAAALLAIGAVLATARVALVVSVRPRRPAPDAEPPPAPGPARAPEETETRPLGDQDRIP